MINLNDLAEQAYLLAQQRNLKTDVVNTLKHCAGEVVEATEVYVNLERDYREYNKGQVALELADLIICALTASHWLDVDIEEYINKAMIKNAQRAYQENNNETA